MAVASLLLGGCATNRNTTTISLASDAYFATDSATLNEGTLPEIERVAELIKLNRFTIRRVIIEGNTDSVGEDAYNQTLSENRANAVYSKMIELQVPKRLLTIKGNGETKPVADNETEEGRAANRRVDVVIHGRLVF